MVRVYLLFPTNQSVVGIIGQMYAFVLYSSLTTDLVSGLRFSADIRGVFAALWSPVAYIQNIVTGHCVRYANLLAYLQICEALLSEFFGLFLLVHTHAIDKANCWGWSDFGLSGIEKKDG
jgi:hypothetical protein